MHLAYERNTSVTSDRKQQQSAHTNQEAGVATLSEGRDKLWSLRRRYTAETQRGGEDDCYVSVFQHLLQYVCHVYR